MNTLCSSFLCVCDFYDIFSSSTKFIITQTKISYHFPNKNNNNNLCHNKNNNHKKKPFFLFHSLIVFVNLEMNMMMMLMMILDTDTTHIHTHTYKKLIQNKTVKLFSLIYGSFISIIYKISTKTKQQ